MKGRATRLIIEAPQGKGITSMKSVLYGLAICVLAMALLCIQTNNDGTRPPANTVTQLTACIGELHVSPRHAVICVVTVVIAAFIPHSCVCRMIDSVIAIIKDWLDRYCWPIWNRLTASIV